MPPGNRKNPQRAASSESQFSLMEFTRLFPDDDACLNYLWRTRYSEDGQTALCPICEAPKVFRKYDGKQQRQAWTCTACGHYLYPTAGTIYHKSSTSLHLWFYALYLMSSTRCGISAKQLERELGVTYKTAWRMFTLIRNQLMTQDDTPLNGAVEVDEMFHGGKPRKGDILTPADRVHWINSKTMVFGAVERNRKEWIDGESKRRIVRHGKVRANVIPSRYGDTLTRQVESKVSAGSVIYSDESRSYKALDRSGWDHRTVDHSSKVYVASDGDAHTQTIDGFWSLVKRGISGTHHASPRSGYRGI